MLHGFEPRCSPHIRRRRDRRIVLPRARVSSLSRASQPTLGQLLPDYGIKDFDIVVGWRFDRRWECVLLAATSISSSLLTYSYTSQAWMGRVKAAGFDLAQCETYVLVEFVLKHRHRCTFDSHNTAVVEAYERWNGWRRSDDGIRSQ